MARPKKSPEDKRTERVVCRYTPQEIEAISSRASASGLRVSEYVRSISLRRKIKASRRVQPDFATQNELNRIGVNLNQLTKHMNAGRAPVVPELVAICDQLDALFTKWAVDE